MTQALKLWAYTNSRGEIYLDQPRTIPVERKTSILNSLTTQEQLFLLFQKGYIHTSVKSGRDITYLPALSDIKEQQKEFHAWVKENHSSQRFSSNELVLIDLVFSIWSKTKKFCENHADSKEIEDEKRRQKQADGFIARLPWYTGNAFTTRQTALLFNSINEIEHPASSNI